eukprot:scaffold18308_cov63-Phaeocystis_antarctica.AAC.4
MPRLPLSGISRSHLSALRSTSAKYSRQSSPLSTAANAAARRSRISARSDAAVEACSTPSSRTTPSCERESADSALSEGGFAPPLPLLFFFLAAAGFDLAPLPLARAVAPSSAGASSATVGAASACSSGVALASRAASNLARSTRSSIINAS